MLAVKEDITFSNDTNLNNINKAADISAITQYDPNFIFPNFRVGKNNIDKIINIIVGTIINKLIIISPFQLHYFSTFFKNLQ